MFWTSCAIRFAMPCLSSIFRVLVVRDLGTWGLGTWELGLVLERIRCAFFYGLNKLCEHFSDFGQFVGRCLPFLFRQITKFSGKQQLVIKLTCRTRSNDQKSGKFGIGITATSFRNIGRHRRGRPPHLACQPEQFLAWKPLRKTINIKRKLMTSLPNL